MKPKIINTYLFCFSYKTDFVFVQLKTYWFCFPNYLFVERPHTNCITFKVIWLSAFEKSSGGQLQCGSILLVIHKLIKSFIFPDFLISKLLPPDLKMANNNRRTMFLEHGGNFFYSQMKKNAKLKVSGGMDSGDSVRGGSENTISLPPSSSGRVLRTPSRFLFLSIRNHNYCGIPTKI